MKKLIEIFQWQFEGERENFFFVVDSIQEFEQDLSESFKRLQHKVEFIFHIIEDIAEDLEKKGYTMIDTNLTWDEEQKVNPRYYIHDDGIDKRELTTKQTDIIKLTL